MQAYLDILRKVKDKGWTKKSRTGTDVLSITGAMFEHDMREGFPLQTTKRVGLRDVAKELAWFIKGDTSKKNLSDTGCKIWNDWASPAIVPYGHDAETKEAMRAEQDLGPVYGYQWRNWGRPYKPIPVIESPHTKNLGIYASSEDLPKNYLSRENVRLDALPQGSEHQHSKYGTYRILSVNASNAVSLEDVEYVVGFLATGTVEGITHGALVTRDELRDPYAPTIAGVACLGYLEGDVPDPDSATFKLWKELLSHSYEIPNVLYPSISYMCRRWLVYSDFKYDVKNVPGYYEFAKHPNDYQFVAGEEASLEDSYFKEKHSPVYEGHFYLVLNEAVGRYTAYESLRSFAKKNYLDISVVRNQYKKHGRIDKFKILEMEAPEDIPISDVEVVDQLKNAVEKLKEDPYDRRMLVSAWNPSDIDKMALPPCHYAFQLVSDGKYLDLLWNQRSVDTPLGLPYNIASYALFLELLAKETNLIPRTLIGFLADVHIYKDQMEGVDTILSRTPGKLPKIKLDDDIELFNWDGDKFKIEGYENQGSVKMPISV